MHHDERWDNFRSYLFLIMGKESTTCIFGIILALVCPIMFAIQNLLLGMCLFEDTGKSLAAGFCHVLQSMRFQLVVLYDLSLFRGTNKTDTKYSWRGVVRLIVGFVLYILPICGFLTLMLVGNAKITLCRLPKATFLLDNNVVPDVSLSSLYQTRRSFAQEILLKHPTWEYTTTKHHGGHGLLVWDFKARPGYRDPYRRFKYWSLENITDLIKQFNYVGYHDVCIYPRIQYDISDARNYHCITSKGLYRVFHGYGYHNSSGADNNSQSHVENQSSSNKYYCS